MFSAALSTRQARNFLIATIAGIGILAASLTGGAWVSADGGTGTGTGTGPGTGPGTGTGGTGPAPIPDEAPGAPTNVFAIAGDGRAGVIWLPPDDHGDSAITAYIITILPGGATREVDSPVNATIIEGLMNGSTYAFTVTAVNDHGAGPASEASNRVTPDEDREADLQKLRRVYEHIHDALRRVRDHFERAVDRADAHLERTEDKARSHYEKSEERAKAQFEKAEEKAKSAYEKAAGRARAHFERLESHLLAVLERAEGSDQYEEVKERVETRLAEAQAALDERLSELNQKLEERLAEAREDLDERLEDIAGGLEERLDQAEEKHDERIEDLRDRMERRISQLIKQLVERLEEAATGD